MNVSTTARQIRDTAVEEAGSIASMARTAGEAVGSHVAEATEMARHAAEQVKHAATEVGERTAKGVHQLQDTIAYRPLTGALVAAGVGFILGAVLMGRRH